MVIAASSSGGFLYPKGVFYISLDGNSVVFDLRLASSKILAKY